MSLPLAEADARHLNVVNLSLQYKASSVKNDVVKSFISFPRI